MAFFSIDSIFASVIAITPEHLREAGLRGLVLDVDNTLTAHGSQQLAPGVAKWLADMKAAGVRMMLASNNYKKRVEPFAEKIGLEYASFVCKPSPVCLMKAAKKWSLSKREIAMVGDQVFTDALAANFYGAQVLLVRPVAADPSRTVRFKRVLEKPFLNRYYKKGGKLL